MVVKRAETRKEEKENKEREGDSSLKRTEQNHLLRVIVKDHKATNGGGVGSERLRVSIHS